MKVLGLAFIRMGQIILRPQGFIVQIVDCNAMDEAFKLSEAAIAKTAKGLEELSKEVAARKKEQNMKKGKGWVM